MTEQEIRRIIWLARLQKEHALTESMRLQYETQDLAIKLKHLSFTFAYSCEGITFHVRTLKELQKTRHELREALGSWKDELSWVQAYSSEWVEVSYQSTSHLRIRIVLKTTVADFPPELKGENCRFEYQSSSSLVYTCTPSEGI